MLNFPSYNWALFGAYLLGTVPGVSQELSDLKKQCYEKVTTVISILSINEQW